MKVFRKKFFYYLKLEYFHDINSRPVILINQSLSNGNKFDLLLLSKDKKVISLQICTCKYTFIDCISILSQIIDR